MAINNLKEAGREISRLMDRNQALEVENAELRDQLSLAGGGKKVKKPKPPVAAGLTPKP